MVMCCGVKKWDGLIFAIVYICWNHCPGLFSCTCAPVEKYGNILQSEIKVAAEDQSLD